LVGITGESVETRTILDGAVEVEVADRGFSRAAVTRMR
jgi:hypothetical protein